MKKTRSQTEFGNEFKVLLFAAIAAKLTFRQASMVGGQRSDAFATPEGPLARRALCG